MINFSDPRAWPPALRVALINLSQERLDLHGLSPEQRRAEWGELYNPAPPLPQIEVKARRKGYTRLILHLDRDGLEFSKPRSGNSDR